MAQHVAGISTSFDAIFLALQAVIVVFLLFHDWVPLGRLNNMSAMKREDSLQHRVFVTLLGAAPAAVCLWLSARRFGQPYPMAVEMWLWITYGLFLAGMLRAWWVPYLLVPDPARAARYQTIFAGTHRFLPQRNGMAPDTLHTVFHVCVVATFVMLCIRERLAG